MRKLISLVALLTAVFLHNACNTNSRLDLSQLAPFDLEGKHITPLKSIVIKQNDLAFASKLDIIRNAEKELRLMYYIFNPDESTSYLTQALISKVESDNNFRIKLLVDYHWNYKNLDFFRYLESVQPHGVQQIEVRFYNRPTVNVIKFAEFMTLGCDNMLQADSSSAKLACSADKQRLLARFDSMTLEQAENAMSDAARTFLAGLYAKNPDGLLYAMQMGYARTIKQMSTGPVAAASITDKQKAQLQRVGQLYWQSRFGDSSQRIGAKLQLGLAGLFFGKQLNPFINALETYLPFTLKDAAEAPLLSHADIDYLTDYSHHKLILGDENTAQIGGRNVENSYHMSPNTVTDKYIFMDTDLYMVLDPVSGKKMAASFDDIWNFREMVASTSDIERHAPIAKLYAIKQATEAAAASCQGKDKAGQLLCAGQIVAEYVIRDNHSLALERQLMWKTQVEKAADTYKNEYLLRQQASKKWNNPQQLFDSRNGYVQSDMVDHSLHSFSYFTMVNKPLYYIENLPFDQSPETPPHIRKRRHGARYGQEAQYGKLIHKTWADAINNACRQSTESGQPVDVIIHQGYFSPPAGLVHLMDKILETNSICPNVRLKIYTNSSASTDLAPVNFLGRRQLFALSQVNDLSSEKFQYFEYQKETLDHVVAEKYLPSLASHLQEKGGSRSSFSLHTKVMIFGNDIYIGSANADVRSYEMDTNNGVFIRNAPDLVARYKQYLKELEDKAIVKPAKESFLFPDEAALQAREQEDIKALVNRYGMQSKLESEQRRRDFNHAIEQINAVMKDAYLRTLDIIKQDALNPKSPFDKAFKMI